MHTLLLCLLTQLPTAEAALKKYDAMMSPDRFKAEATMTAHREDGTTRAYSMTIVKVGNDKSRISFKEPASARGQEILRNGDNSWIYMPNLKRSLRLAARDSFQGGDFNNADVLRANYSTDYGGTLTEDPAKPDAWLLELKSKTADASYDSIKLWVKREPLGVPIRGEYYTQSGKMLRSAEFLDPKELTKGSLRPTRIKMRNELATERYSELSWQSMETAFEVPDSRFGMADLGH